MTASDLQFLQICLLGLLLPVVLYLPARALLRALLAEQLSGEAKRTHAGAMGLAGSLVLLALLLTPLLGPAQTLPLAGLVLLALAMGTAEEALRLASQFTMPHRVLLGTLCYAAGFHFDLATLLLGHPSRWLGLLIDFPLTVLFLAGIVTTIEVLDRLRGLASGVVMIVAGTLLALVLHWNFNNAPLLMMGLFAVLVGHLVLVQWNRRAHLGKAGHLVLGVFLAVSTLVSRSWGFTVTMFALPLLALLLPLADRIFLGLYRLSHGTACHPPGHLQSAFLYLGVSERFAVLFIWILTLHAGVLIKLVHASKSVPFAVGAGLSVPLLGLFAVGVLIRLGERLERRLDPKRLRILFLSHYFHPEVNAPATRLFEHARLWAAAGHDVTVIVPTPSAPHGWPYPGYSNRLWEEEVIEGIRVVRVWTFVAANRRRLRRTLNYLSYMVSALAALVLVRRHDVIVATSPQFFCGLAGAIASLFRPEPFVLEVRDLWPESIEAVGAGRPGILLRGVHALARWMYGRARAIITVGDGYRDRLLELRAAPPERLFVIPNGVVPADIAIAAPGRPTLRRFGIADRFVVAYVGTIGMAHGLGILLEAAPAARQLGVTFLVVGDGAERATLQRRAEELGLTDVVRFVGLVPRPDAMAVLAEADACLVHLRKTPLFETVLPSKLLEAMGAGKPVLLGVEGHAARILRAADAGICFPPEDASALLAAVEELRRHPEATAAMGTRGAAAIQANYRREVLAEHYVQVLRALRDAHSDPTPPQTPIPRGSRESPSAILPRGA